MFFVSYIFDKFTQRNNGNNYRECGNNPIFIVSNCHIHNKTGHYET